MKQKTTREFIDQSKEKFLKRFTYSKTKYKGATTKVIITCKLHGDFSIRPSDHLYGNGGCNYCSNTVKHTKESFIEKAKQTHNNKYDYSKVEFTTMKKDVIIVCPVHGEYYQKPRNHIGGSGCILCGISQSAAMQTKSLATFIQEANNIHSNRYTYSETKYNNTTTPVKIGCPIHGVFLQTPHTHLKGSGCPECALTLKAENYRNLKTYLYYVKFDNNIYKIGISKKSVTKRFRGCKSPEIIGLWEFTDGYFAFKAERSIIKTNKHLQYNSAKFINNKGTSCGESECFIEDVSTGVVNILSTFKNKYTIIKDIHHGNGQQRLP